MTESARFFPERLDLPDTITGYDLAHFRTYVRILGVDRELTDIDGRDWREASRNLLGRDPDIDEAGARRCWEAHLARARWLIGGEAQAMLEAAACPRH